MTTKYKAIMDFGLRIFGLQISYYGFSDYGLLRISFYGFSDYGFRITDFGLQITDFGPVRLFGWSVAQLA